MTSLNKTYKGIFKPKNPAKYNGDASNIIYRSSWELRVMKYFDDNPNVIWWASEELSIPYKSPVDNRMHKYYPDFVAKLKVKTGLIKTVMIEVKPNAQTKMPVQKRKTKRFIQEAATYAINQEKWRAADLFCKEHGWQFQILTENELGL
jgi:hypothetical protein